jgi:hypothetical protein
MFVPGAPPPPPPANGPSAQNPNIPPETLRLAKRLGYLNILLSLMHLGASVAIIGLIRYNLEDYSVSQTQGGDVALSYSCLMGAAVNANNQCSYAYSTAAGSGERVFVRQGRLVGVSFNRHRRHQHARRSRPRKQNNPPPKKNNSPRLLHPVAGAVPHARLRW